MIKGKGKGRGKSKKGMRELGFVQDWSWWGSDWQGDWSGGMAGMNSLAPQTEEPWMRRLCPMTKIAGEVA